MKRLLVIFVLRPLSFLGAVFWRWLRGWIRTPSGKSTTSGAALGGWIGTTMGIAAFGGAIAATIPFAVVGGLFGWLSARAFRSK